MMQEKLSKLTGGADLSHSEAFELSVAMIASGNSSALIGALLAALKTKGEKAQEISGFVAGLRSHAVKIPVIDAEYYDVAGTGGDGAHTLNISTLTAIIMSGAGMNIAKHGNRSVSSRSGSADVLYETGVNIHATPGNIALQLKECGLGFIYAPLAHPAMKNVMETRKALGIPSIFNLSGPLSNPVPLKGQVVGVYSPALLPLMADALQNLGTQCGAVIHGHGGLDEASLSGPNQIIFLENQQQVHASICPSDLGLTEAPISALKGGAPSENSKAMVGALKGERNAYRDAALFNSAIGIYSFGKAETLKDAMAAAVESIDSGRALAKLEKLIEVSNRKDSHEYSR